MQPPSEKATWCQVLGVTPEATADEIRQAYRNLATVWHPDRFAAPHLKTLAEEKLKEINIAYESLEAALGPEPKRPADANVTVTLAPAPVVAPRRAFPAWAGLAVALLTVLAVGGLFYLVGGGSRTRPKEVQTPVAENIPPPPASEVPAAAPKPRAAAPPKAAEIPTQPETGQLEKAKPPFGAGRLTVTNDTHLDAYSRLMTKTRGQKQLLTIYIRSGESYSVTGLPVGEYMLQTDVGRGWLPTAGAFAGERQALEPVGPLTYLRVQTAAGVQSDEYTVALSAGESKTVFRIPGFSRDDRK